MVHRRPPRKPLMIAKAARHESPRAGYAVAGLLLLALLLIGLQAGGVV
ncbi:MAG: hypothetical protein AAF610_11610 [Pseudomonadota bacterium]